MKRVKSFSNEKIDLLIGLSEDMLYETHDNYPEYSESEAYECTLDHVILVITEMDEDGVYSSLLPFADYENKYFCKIVEQTVRDHYYDYEWYDQV